MRLLDLGMSVGRQLDDLPYPAYLLSMSVIARRLGEIYADLMPEGSRLLAAQTADAAKAAYLSGGATADDAWQLHRRWEELVNHPGPDGLLACEVAGKLQPRAALDQVTNAAKLPDPMAPHPAEPQQVQGVHGAVHPQR